MIRKEYHMKEKTEDKYAEKLSLKSQRKKKKQIINQKFKPENVIRLSIKFIIKKNVKLLNN